MVWAAALALAAVLAAAATAQGEADRIPAAFQGTWAPTQAECAGDDETGRVTIAAQSIDFYEVHGRLNMGQVFTAAGADAYVGRFSFKGELSFWDSVIRLERAGDRIVLRNQNDQGSPGRPTYWHRCPAT